MPRTRTPWHRGPGHHPARAKRVIFLFMHGGPSHVDTFDYKPRLQQRRRQDLPLRAGQAGRTVSRKLMASPWKFAQHGESGLWVSRAVPRGGQARRRPVHHRTACTPKAGATAQAVLQAAHRRPVPDPAVDGLVGRSTAWAPRTRTCPASSPSARPAATAACELRQRLPAGRLPGHADRAAPASRPRRPAIRNIANPAARAARSSAAARLAPELNRDHLEQRRRRRPALEGGHRVVRAGLPHADGACRG